jgi:hypothetical protein
LAEEMRRSPAPALLPPPLDDEDAPTNASTTNASTTKTVYTEPPEVADDLPSAPAAPAEGGSDVTTLGEPTGRHRHTDLSTGEGGTASPAAASARSARRTKRSSVPSWDDIMFGAKQD